MSTSGVRLALIMLVAVVIASGGWVASVWAQMQSPGDSTVIHSGNADIIFEPAGAHGLPMARYQAFDAFASGHPAIVKALARNPRLVNERGFTSRHPALADFLRTHPDIATDFARNPGNYVVVQPAVEASLKRHPVEPR